MSFVLLKSDMPQLKPYVFSAADGVIYPYQWTRKDAELAREVERLTQKSRRLLKVNLPRQSESGPATAARFACPAHIIYCGSLRVANKTNADCSMQDSRMPWIPAKCYDLGALEDDGGLSGRWNVSSCEVSVPIVRFAVLGRVSTSITAV